MRIRRIIDLGVFPLSPSKRRAVPGLLVLGTIFCALLALASGVISISPSVLPSALLGNSVTSVGLPEASEVETMIVREVRLPRLVLGLLTGAVLATAGGALQGLFRNPLADPGLIGVSAGGAVGAGAVIALSGGFLAGGVTFLSGIYATMAGAAIGAVGTTVLIYSLSRTEQGPSVPAMLLCGIAVNTFAGALIGVFVFSSGLEQIRDLAFWTLGSLSRAPSASVYLAIPVLLGAILLLCTQAKALNALLLGEETAQTLGVQPQRVKRIVFLGSGLGVGAAVALTGTIGFVGLVVPHICRIIVGTDHRYLLPTSALAGGLLLAGTDLAARTLLGAAELPTGILTALLGAPFFLALLVYERRRLHLPL